MRLDVGRDQAGTAPGSDAREQARLAARPRAHVEPQPVRPDKRGAGERDRRELARLVLYRRPAIGHSGDVRGISFLQVGAVR